MKQSDKEDISAEAQKALVSVENSGSVSGYRMISGRSLAIPLLSRMKFLDCMDSFYIESDTHTFTNGKAQMDLTLAF